MRRAALQLGDTPFVVANVPLGRLGIEGGNLRGQKVDGRFKLFEALPFGGQETDGEVANAFRDLVAKDGECALALGRDEDAVPGGEVMADYIGDRIVFPVPGGPCTTTPSTSGFSSRSTMEICSSLKGLGKKN